MLIWNFKPLLIVYIIYHYYAPSSSQLSRQAIMDNGHINVYVHLKLIWPNLFVSVVYDITDYCNEITFKHQKSKQYSQKLQIPIDNNAQEAHIINNIIIYKLIASKSTLVFSSANFKQFQILFSQLFLIHRINWFWPQKDRNELVK